MPIKQYKPTSPGRRNASSQTYGEITKKKPEKSLTESLRGKSAGRNNQGRITVRSRGGGSRRLYRIIDWKRNKPGVPGKVVAIEYDPNRTARIALIQYADGEKRYILAPNGLAVGAVITSGPNSDVRVGNSLPLASMPTGTQVHNIELTRAFTAFNTVPLADLPNATLAKLADQQSHGALVLGDWIAFEARDWATQTCRVRIRAIQGG